MIVAGALALLAVLALVGLVVNAHLRPPEPPVLVFPPISVTFTERRVVAICGEPWPPNSGTAQE